MRPDTRRLLVLSVVACGIAFALALRGQIPVRRAASSGNVSPTVASPLSASPEPLGTSEEIEAGRRDMAALLGTAAELRRLHADIKPGCNEAHWKQIPWMTSLWKARQRAASESRPMLLWCMDGSPLGST